MLLIDNFYDIYCCYYFYFKKIVPLVSRKAIYLPEKEIHHKNCTTHKIYNYFISTHSNVKIFNAVKTKNFCKKNRSIFFLQHKHIFISKSNNILLQKFEDYLKKEIANSLSSLESNPQNRLEYRNLLECVYCSIMVFNKRRVGELERMPIDLYEKSNTVKSLEFEKLLTETEKILYSSLKRVVIRGKRGRGVPVLIDKKTEVALDTLIKLRTNFNLDNNIYLFGLPETSNPISGYNVMRKHAQIALGDVKKASLLTSTKLRKHLGTIAQIFRMEKNDLEQLAGFLGHTEKTHAEWYRLPNDIYQTAKVSKLLMLSKSTNIEKYKGLSLDEININDCVIEETYENEEEAEDTEIVQNENECDIPSTSNIPSTSYIASTSDKVHNHKKRTLVPWTKNQKRIAQLFFKKHIKTKTPPKKHEVLEMVQQNPKMFENKSWQVIKVFICNIYNKH